MTLCSRRHLSSTVSARTRPWGLSLRGFPPFGRAVDSFEPRIPLAVSCALHPTDAAGRLMALTHNPDCRVYTRSKVPLRTAAVNRDSREALLGVFPLRGLQRSIVDEILIGSISPRALEGQQQAAIHSVPQGISDPTRDRSLARRVNLLGVCSLIAYLDSTKSWSAGPMVYPQKVRDVAARCPSLRASADFCRSSSRRACR